MMIDTQDKKSLVKTFLAISNVKEVQSELNELHSELPRVEHEINDILHLLEFKSFNASMGYKYAKQLKDARNRRRQIKEDIELLKAYIKLLPSQTNSLKAVLGGLEKAKRYTPRVREDLKCEFDTIYEKNNGNEGVVN